MSIQKYIKEIGRGRDGARALTREQATDLFAQVLNRQATDLEIGAFCVAMRIKGETVAEMHGFMDAARASMELIAPSASGCSTVVIPCYNGARRYPVLTPLLALLLVQRGVRVIMHGVVQESGRTTSAQVLAALGISPLTSIAQVSDTGVNFLPIEVLAPSLHWLLRVRYTIGLRNSAHSLVKLMNPCRRRAIVVGSYTHAEYRVFMDAMYRHLQSDAILLRGLEGEAVADARRFQQIDAYIGGQHRCLQQAQQERISAMPSWPSDVSAGATAQYIREIVAGAQVAPPPVLAQVSLLEQLSQQVPA
ncbi:hypothetical protein AAV94_05675 [Lampropedia cohaerens]|uniref:Glycosyl transferase family 3 N-terminal domain-containing protein n=1 Tax=Lampropedia cohaerens TaxID=1610491 RepID=A0A0U1Q0M1_9BURK|nr:DNA-binding protein YbiB [Lampropedia cohaerens]KKW68302.1 hypothetical protein AAV94_05675 [Lampropedia cohaerens]